MTQLSELQQDALTEAFNLGMGMAASALSEIVESSVLLSVPELQFLTHQKALEAFNQKSQGSVCGVSQTFSGLFSGKTMLLFPEGQSLELVRLLLRDTVPLDQLTEFEEEALNEVGNIILNAGVGSLANLFGHEIKTSLPSFSQGSYSDVLGITNNSNDDSMVMILRVDFRLEQFAVEGYVVFLLDVASMQDLISCIDKYLSSFAG